jgi:RNA polymerase sigma factor (sigma-70 family)
MNDSARLVCVIDADVSAREAIVGLVPSSKRGSGVRATGASNRRARGTPPAWDSCAAPRATPVERLNMANSLLITPQTIDALTPGLLRFARRLAWRREDAEDLVQDTWCSAIKSAGTYRARASLQAWLRGIMRRRWQDRLRRERPAELLDEEYHGASAAPSPEQFDWARAANQTSAALAKLTELERRAVVLCDVLDLDRDQATQQLNVSRNHLRVILHRARHKLAHALRAEGAGLELCA